jgi:hypothetical protein
MDNWITFSVPGWAIAFALSLGIGKRLGHQLGPGTLNVIGSVILMAMFFPVFLLYWSIVESPNEKRLRELEQRVGEVEPSRQ